MENSARTCTENSVGLTDVGMVTNSLSLVENSARTCTENSVGLTDVGMVTSRKSMCSRHLCFVAVVVVVVCVCTQKRYGCQCFRLFTHVQVLMRAIAHVGWVPHPAPISV